MKNWKLVFVLVFGYCSFTFCQTNYYWNGAGNGNATTSWGQNIDGSGTQPTNFTTANQIFNIQNGQNLNVFSGTWTVSGTNSKVSIQSGGKITTTANHSIPLEMLGGAIYEMSGSYTSLTQSGTWSATSTFVLKTSNFRSALSYGNLEINASGIVDNGATLTVSGNLIISAGTFRFGTASTNNITGDVQISSGATWNIANNANAQTYNISGTITNNGTISAGGSGLITINLNGSNNVSLSWGIKTATNHNITIANGKTVTFTSDLSIATGRTLTVNGTLNCGTTVISGAGSFTLASGATLITANTTGISGSINVSGTKTFNSSANFEFQGSATGTFTTTPTASRVNNLTINSGGTDLSQVLTVGGSLNFTSGKLNLNGNPLTVTTISGASSSNYIIADVIGSSLIKLNPRHSPFQ